MLLHVLHEQLHLLLTITINQTVTIAIDAPNSEPRPQCSAVEAKPLERCPELLPADLPVAVGINTLDPLLELLLAGEVKFRAVARDGIYWHCYLSVAID